MPTEAETRLRDKVLGLTERYGTHRSALIPILTELKASGPGLDSESMQVVADVLDIHPVEVYSVSTFYAFLHPEQQARYVFRLCRTLSCELQGRDEVAEALRTQLGCDFGQTSEDGLFALEWAACMGMCDQGPALLVNDTVYTRLTPESVSDVVAECRDMARAEVTA